MSRADRKLPQPADQKQWVCPECDTANFISNQSCRHVGCRQPRPNHADRVILQPGETPPRARAPPARQNRARSGGASLRGGPALATVADLRRLEAAVLGGAKSGRLSRPPSRGPSNAGEGDAAEDDEEDPWVPKSRIALRGLPKGFAAAVAAISDEAVRAKVEAALTEAEKESATPLIEARSSRAAAALRRARKAFDAATREVAEAQIEVRDAHARLDAAQTELSDKADQVVVAEDEVSEASAELAATVAAEKESPPPDPGAELRGVVQSLRELRIKQRDVLQKVSMAPETEAKFAERLDTLGDTAQALEQQLSALDGDIREQAARAASSGEDPLQPDGHFSKAPPPGPPAGTLPAAASADAMDLTGGDANSFEERFPTLAASVHGSGALASARAKKNKQPLPKLAPKAPPYVLRNEVPPPPPTAAGSAAASVTGGIAL